MPRKGFDTLEIKFLCPHCGEKLNGGKEKMFAKLGDVIRCEKCSTEIEFSIIAPPPVVNAINGMEVE
jgi:transcription elongation factor Elf1